MEDIETRINAIADAIDKMTPEERLRKADQLERLAAKVRLGPSAERALDRVLGVLRRGC